MTPLLSQILTFLGGAAGTVAAISVGGEYGIPKWVVVACIIITGGAAKLSHTPLAPAKKDQA